MRIEVKGLLAALAAGLAVLGATFAVAALLVRAQAARERPHALAARTAAVPAGPLDPQSVARGRAFYVKSCASCHGASGGGGIGPSLHHETMGDARIAATIKNGVKGSMPAFGRTYTDAQVKDLVAFIRSLP